MGPAEPGSTLEGAAVDGHSPGPAQLSLLNDPSEWDGGGAG